MKQHSVRPEFERETEVKVFDETFLKHVLTPSGCSLMRSRAAAFYCSLHFWCFRDDKHDTQGTKKGKFVSWQCEQKKNQIAIFSGSAFDVNIVVLDLDSQSLTTTNHMVVINAVSQPRRCLQRLTNPKHGNDSWQQSRIFCKWIAIYNRCRFDCNDICVFIYYYLFI